MSSSTVTPTPTPTIMAVPSASPSAVLDETADWLSYSNSFLQYSIKYPPAWKVLDLSQGTQVEIYYQPDKTKSVGAILIEKVDQAPRDISRYVDSKTIGSLTAKCMSDEVSKTWCYLENGETVKISILITEDQDDTYNQTLDKILSTFIFTGSPDLSLKYPITNNPEKNIYLVFPKGTFIDKDIITIGNSSFLINTSVGPGLCPMDSQGDSCTYTDQPSNVWGYYRVWTKNTKSFAINPQVLTIEGVYSDGLIITKTTPNTYFSEAELNQWKEIINSVEIGK